MAAASTTRSLVHLQEDLFLNSTLPIKNIIQGASVATANPADFTAVAVALNASVKAISGKGERTIPVEELLVDLLTTHGLAISAGVTFYVGASNLIPEFQVRGGWAENGWFFAGIAAYAAAAAIVSA